MIHASARHIQLIRPSSTKLARRLVYRDARHAAPPHGSSVTMNLGLLAATSRAEMHATRGFSSSRLYATALYSEQGPSTETPPPGMRVSSANDTALVRGPSAAVLEEVDEPIEPSNISFKITPRAAEVRISLSSLAA